MATKLKPGQHLVPMAPQNLVWRSYHALRAKPTIQGRHWFSASYVLPMECKTLDAIVINGEVVFDVSLHGRRSSGVLSSGGTWRLQRRFIAGEYVSLTLELQNTLIRKIRKKATKVAVILEVV